VQALIMLTFDSVSPSDDSMPTVIRGLSARVQPAEVTSCSRECALPDGSTIMCNTWVESSGTLLTIGKKSICKKAYKMCLPPIWRAVVLALHKLFNVKLNASLSAIPASGVAFVQPQLAQKAICDLRADRGKSRRDQASYGPLVGTMGARTTGGGGSVRCAQERALAAKDVAGGSGTFHLMPGLSRLREFRQEHAGSILGSYPFVCGPFHPELFITLSHTITHSVNQATALSSSRLYPSCPVLTLSQQWRRPRHRCSDIAWRAESALSIYSRRNSTEIEFFRSESRKRSCSARYGAWLAGCRAIHL
jgi:hypothetical protein